MDNKETHSQRKARFEARMEGRDPIIINRAFEASFILKQVFGQRAVVMPDDCTDSTDAHDGFIFMQINIGDDITTQECEQIARFAFSLVNADILTEGDDVAVRRGRVLYGVTMERDGQGREWYDDSEA